MKKLTPMALFLAAMLLPESSSVAKTARAAPNLGVQQAEAPVSGDSPVKLLIFYPTSAPSHSQQWGPYKLDVAKDATPIGKRLPLIVMSHGTGGNAFNSVNQAEALARAGYVVAALEHTGDNVRDQSRSFASGNIAGRAAQVSATIDYVLRDWAGHAVLDPSRIGVFGYSAGGTTALVVGGGVLDWHGVVADCTPHPQVFGCQQSKARATAANQPTRSEPISSPDPRVKAIISVVPALSPGFAPNGLKSVRRPVQLWVAAEDEIVADGRPLVALFPKKPDFHLIANAGHTSLLAPCDAGMKKTLAWLCTDPKGFDRAAFQQEFVKQVLAFYRSKLR